MASTPLPENHAPFTPEEILEAASATMIVSPSHPLRGVSTDSRAVKSGNLFVALRGERHDGHAHLAQAIERGAHAVIVERSGVTVDRHLRRVGLTTFSAGVGMPSRSGATNVSVEREVEVPPGVGVFQVDDTLAALGALGGHHRRRYDIPVVAITGSVGKTSTKDLVAAALSGIGKSVAFTRGNLNNRIGVPLTLLTLGPEHEAAVIEIGMNVPGEIADLTAITAPTVGVVTAVAEVHTEGVGGLDGVLREKGALLSGLGPSAVAVWNADEARLGEYAERAARRIGYGRVDDADVRLVRWELDGHGGTLASYRVPGREGAIDVRLTMLGESAAVNAAGALAVIAAIDGSRIDAAAAALHAVRPAHHRMVPVELASGLLVIDDTYNASPRSAVAALETAALLASTRGGALIAVLGDMLELGREAERLHADVGREAVRAGAAALITCGELMTHAGRAAINAAASEPRGARAKVILLKNADDAAACARELAGERDVVLVKGSRGMRMERVVDALQGAAHRGEGTGEA